MSDNEPTGLYQIAARVKNLARDYDAHLTPMGEVLCNSYVLVLKDLYDFAETIPEPYRENLQRLIGSKEDLPRKIIELGKKQTKKSI